MKVLLYINTISRFNYGNLISNLELMKGFVEKGVEVVFAANRKTPEDVPLPVDVFFLDARGDFDRPLRLREVVRRVKPDAVIANMLTQITTASFTKLMLGSVKVKFLGVERDTRPWHRKLWKLPYRLFVKKVYENMDRLVAISPAVERDLTETFFVRREKVKLIYNPLDLKGIRERAKEPLGDKFRTFFERGRVLVCVGRIDKQKEPLLALEVFRKVRERVKNLKLCFVGSGELENELRGRIRAYSLEEEVLITGYVENPFSFMSRSDLLIHTASREGLGRVILEGMVLGLPVVAFYNRDSGYRELLEESGGGVLVPFGDIEGMAEKVSTLLHNRDMCRRLSANATKASERFSRERVVEEYISLIG